jgi:hypothetical protein
VKETMCKKYLKKQMKTYLTFLSFSSLSLSLSLFIRTAEKIKTTQKLQQAASSKRGTRTETCSFTTSG